MNYKINRTKEAPARKTESTQREYKCDAIAQKDYKSAEKCTVRLSSFLGSLTIRCLEAHKSVRLSAKTNEMQQQTWRDWWRTRAIFSDHKISSCRAVPRKWNQTLGKTISFLLTQEGKSRLPEGKLPGAQRRKHTPIPFLCIKNTQVQRTSVSLKVICDSKKTSNLIPQLYTPHTHTLGRLM